MSDFDKAIALLETVNISQLTTPSDPAWVDDWGRICPMMYLARELGVEDVSNPDEEGFLQIYNSDKYEYIAEKVLLNLGVPLSKVGRVKLEVTHYYDRSTGRFRGVQRVIELLKKLREAGWTKEGWLA